MKFWALAVSGLSLAGSVSAESVTLGRTYPIAERDALTEIEHRAGDVDWDAELSSANIEWSAKKGYPVVRAVADRSRQFIPYYTVEFDVADAAGRIIYPKGFRFNPLDHITLPYRVVVIDPADLEWVKPKLRSTDMVILTSGDFEQASEGLQRPIFLLDQKTKQRLGIEVVPAIIEQSGNVFMIDEYFVEVES